MERFETKKGREFLYQRTQKKLWLRSGQKQAFVQARNLVLIVANQHTASFLYIYELENKTVVYDATLPCNTQYCQYNTLLSLTKHQ